MSAKFPAFRLARQCAYAAVMVGFVGLAIRGHWRWELWWTPTMRPQIQMVNYTDRVEFSLVWYPTTVNPAWGRGGYAGHEQDGPSSWIAADRETHWDDELSTRVECFGIMFRAGLKSTSGSEVPRNDAPIYSLMFPQWMPAVLAAIPLMVAAWRWRKRLSPDQILCGICTYDLRAHKAGDKCPECGTKVVRADYCPPLTGG